MAKKQSAARQKNGTGSFYHRKDGTVQYRVYMGIGADGKPWRPSFYGKDEKEALKAYKDWLKSSGETPIEKVKAVGEWADKWLELYKKTGRDKVAYSTYRNYKMYVDNHIKPHIGKLKFEQVKPAHIEQLYSRLPKDMSYSARRHINIALNGIFKTAVENRFCKENPIKSMPMPTIDSEDIKVFTPKQVEKIIRDAKTDPDGMYVQFPLYSGMRVGEITALQWSSVDYKNGEIRVKSAMTRAEDGGYEEGKTKSRKSRVVPISPELEAVLKSIPVNGLYVFSDDGSAPLSHHQYEYRYARFFKRTDAPYLSPHKCRHTYATYLLRGGADLRVIQTLLGHSKISVTEIYTEVNVDDLKNNVARLGY